MIITPYIPTPTTRGSLTEVTLPREVHEAVSDAHTADRQARRHTVPMRTTHRAATRPAVIAALGLEAASEIVDDPRFSFYRDSFIATIGGVEHLVSVGADGNACAVRTTN
jgi:hypothetical protein